jgi:hypothetical protein
MTNGNVNVQSSAFSANPHMKHQRLLYLLECRFGLRILNCQVGVLEGGCGHREPRFRRSCRSIDSDRESEGHWSFIDDGSIRPQKSIRPLGRIFVLEVAFDADHARRFPPMHPEYPGCTGYSAVMGNGPVRTAVWTDDPWDRRSGPDRGRAN